VLSYMFAQVKSFQNPPEAVRTVMEAVCLLLGESQDWDSAKKVLGRTSFITDLRVRWNS
jgi:dynein heavy chain, axonemal